MSRSYRTEKASVIATRAAARTKRPSDLPRIVVRKPASGDVHPLSKRGLTMICDRIPREYLSGLRRIELRARNAAVGNPFAWYYPDERSIILYSLPTLWRLPKIGIPLRRSLRRFYAVITPSKGGFEVAWPDDAIMSLWFYSFVFTHELGHHFVEQYHSKNGRIRGRPFEEAVADLHAERLTQVLFKKGLNS